jgi:integrase/recombinase XerD
MLDFIDYCNLDDALSGVEGMSKKHINTVLLSVRNYYRYLKRENETIINPATNLYIKGIVKKMPTSIINYQELESLYQNYQTETLRDSRNKIILGLLVYQGLTTEELHQLEPNNLKLKEGKINVPGNRKRNSRILELKPFQILELQEYVTEIRPKILNEITAPRPTRKPDKINKTRIESQLFISINGSENIKNSLLHLFKDIQKINPNITNAQQIRQSTITYWLKTMNLRQVQYFAGHKYVSSTERYKMNDLEGLQIRLEKYHPLRPHD